MATRPNSIEGLPEGSVLKPIPPAIDPSTIEGIPAGSTVKALAPTPDKTPNANATPTAVPVPAAPATSSTPAAAPVVPIWQSPNVVQHMGSAWKSAGNGNTNEESSFIMLKGSPVPVPMPPTHDYHKETFSIEPDTQAIFHTHPNSADPMPSDADKKIADKFHVQMYVMSSKGLSLYDPATKTTTFVSQNLDYLPPDARTTQQTAVDKAMSDAWKAATQKPKK
jgi:hypothetical protein